MRGRPQMPRVLMLSLPKSHLRMFNNLVNRHDLSDFLRMAMRLTLPRNLFTLDAKARVRNAWHNHTLQESASSEAAAEMLSARFNRLISGNPQVSRFTHAAQAYLADRRAVGISLGSGSGEHELSWFATGGFARIDGYDLSPSRVEIANAKAREAGVGDGVRFVCGDILNLSANPATYDVVILESSLHHFSPLERVVELMKTILKPGGLVFMCEFVGPTRFQWTDRQLEIVNGILGVLPEKYRVLPGGDVWRRVFRPSLARMYLSDPSEAVESARILPLMEANFRVLERRNAGGAILYHLFPRLIENFRDDDPEARDWMQFCIDIEDRFIDRTEEVDYWYVFGVYQMPSDEHTRPSQT